MKKVNGRSRNWNKEVWLKDMWVALLTHSCPLNYLYQKLYIHSGFNPEILQSGFYCTDLLKNVQNDECAQIFTAALSVIAVGWK